MTGAEAFMDQIVRLVRERLEIPFLFTCRGTVVAVNAADNTCTVSCWWGQIPYVKVAQPWPGCKVVYQKGADVVITWPKNKIDGVAQPGELPVIVGFYSGEPLEIEIVTGGQPAARKFDTVDCGTLSLVFDGSGTYTGPNGATTAIVPGVPFAIQGKISSGSTKVKIGG